MNDTPCVIEDCENPGTRQITVEVARGWHFGRRHLCEEHARGGMDVLLILSANDQGHRSMRIIGSEESVVRARMAEREAVAT